MQKIDLGNVLDRSTVLCGGHRANSCRECDQGHGASWCNGDCIWADNKCKDKPKITTTTTTTTTTTRTTITTTTTTTTKPKFLGKIKVLVTLISLVLTFSATNKYVYNGPNLLL